MTKYPFRNHWYRLYFELRDAFAHNRCPLCALLSELEPTLIAGFFALAGSRKKFDCELKALCLVHKTRFKKIGANDPSLLTMLKRATGDSLRELAHLRRRPKAKWRRWFEPFRAGCPLCSRLSSQERTLCRTLIRFLEDTDFWKKFATAPLLCLDHLEKCLRNGETGVGFERLRNDQSAKLNALLNDLIRFEATGTHVECKASALNWLADFLSPALETTDADEPLDGADVAPEAISQATPDSLAEGSPDRERVFFENERLTREVKDLMERLGQLETSDAAFCYQVATLSEDNKRLEMGYTGANLQADGLKQLVQVLRKEIHQLKNGTAEPRTKTRS
jgi:uncharacterized protein DUF6062